MSRRRPLVLLAALLVALAAATPASARRLDRDRDGMPDAFERAHRLNPHSRRDAHKDPDRDRLSNLAEFRARTNPRRADTDGDGIGDGRELAARTNPRDRRAPRAVPIVPPPPAPVPVAPQPPVASPTPAPARAATEPVGFQP